MIKGLPLQLFTILKNKIEEYNTKRVCNMSSQESYLRISIAILLFSYSLFNDFTLLTIFSVVLGYTGVTRYCTIYRIFDINRKIALETIYLKYLPKYNPEPVMILDKTSNIIFKNEPAKKNLDISNFSKQIKNPIEIINEEKTFTIQYESSDKKVYLINLRGVKKIGYILAYATDITEVLKAEKEVIDIQKDVVYTMGAIGETRSKETGNHVKRVAIYSEILALKYGLSKEEAELLKLASPMHDIGKVGIKDEILNKPGKLTDDEFKIMKGHASLGYKMLKNSEKPILKAAAIVAHEHHEKWDGTGYPRKLKEEQIHIFGRITAIADVFDALGSDRVYKKAWPLEKIFEFFKEQRGKHFDPNLVDIFFEHFDEINEIRLKYQDK